MAKNLYLMVMLVVDRQRRGKSSKVLQSFEDGPYTYFTEWVLDVLNAKLKHKEQIYASFFFLFSFAIQRVSLNGHSTCY